MQLKKIIGSATAVVAIAVAGVLYAVHPAKGSDHQDTYNLAQQVGHNASADITDVYVFPAPDNANNVVLAMDVFPLIPTGMGPSKVFDPTLMWQFKISHGAATSPEDQTIQFSASGASSSQILTMYGPGKVSNVGTTSTFISPSTGSTTLGNTANLQNNTIKFYAGPRADPFTFDLFAFFSFLGDRNFATHTSQTDPGTYSAATPTLNGNNVSPTSSLAPAGDKPAVRAAFPPQDTSESFNGFTQGTRAGANAPLGNRLCSTVPASNSLGTFNVLSFVVEIPKSLLETNGASHSINVWATVSSSTTTN